MTGPSTGNTAGPERAEDTRTAPAAGDRENQREPDDGAQLVPVDPEPLPRTIYATAHAVREHERRPIVPAYLRNRHEAAQLARWLSRHGAHVTGYHLTRAPLYALRLAWRAPRGARVAVTGAVRWVFDAEAAPLRLGAVARNDVREYMTLSSQRNRRVRQRGAAAAGVVALAAVLLALLWWVGTPSAAEVPGPAAQRIAERARAAREAAGTLTGHAAGEQQDAPLTPAAQLLDDLAVVFATVTDARVWSETVLRRLAEHRPQLYAEWTPEGLAAALRPLGITTGQVWGRTDDGAGANRRGVTRAEVLAAIEAHHRTHPEITT